MADGGTAGSRSGGAPFRLGHRPALDGFRGVAVLMVLAGHIGIPRIARAGTVGVTLFFVLSGFLITSLLLQEHEGGGVSFRRFYARRALRLLPALYVVLAVVGVYAAIDGTVNAPVLFPAVYLANVAGAAGRDLGVFGHMWSLSLEEQFYLVWPGLLIWSLRRGTTAAVALSVLGIAASLTSAAVLIGTGHEGADWVRVNLGPDTRSYALFLGCLLALVVPALLRRAALARALSLPALLVCVVASLVGDRSPAFYLVLLPAAALAGAVLILDLLPGDGVLGRVLRWPTLTWLGRISYGLYLWHQCVYQILRPHLLGVPFPVRATILVALSVAVAALSHAVVERPFLRLKGRFRPHAEVPMRG